MCLRNAVGVCAWYERMKDRETENEIEQKSVVKERWGHCRNSNGEEPYFSTSLLFPHLAIYIFMCHTLWLITPSFDSYITWHGYIILLWSHFTAECSSRQICHLFNSKLSYSIHMDQQYGGLYGNDLWYNNGCVVSYLNWICYNIIDSSDWQGVTVTLC